LSKWALKEAAFNQRTWLFSAALVLSACSGTTLKQTGVDSENAYRDRMENIVSIDTWYLAGKISLDDGDQGGSGKLQWRVSAANSSIDFHGAMGRGAWHLDISPDRAVLREAGGDEHSAPGVDSLIQQQMGWPVPVVALKWWVRGLVAPGPVEAMQLDDQGLLTSLIQSGWQVEFERYSSASGIPMPKRLNARQDNYRVKLAISDWQMDTGTSSE